MDTPRTPAAGRRMTNAEFAERVGITESYASYLRAGKRSPGASVLSDLIEGLELDAVGLMRAYRAGPETLSKFLELNTPRV